MVNAGTIPDRGLYGVYLGEGGPRVGELDEEMVYESRAGETFMLGATTWRIEQITRDQVIVSPAPGEPGKMPFWKGDGMGGRWSSGRAVGAFTRELEVERDPRNGGVERCCSVITTSTSWQRATCSRTSAEENEATGALPDGQDDRRRTVSVTNSATGGS